MNPIFGITMALAILLPTLVWALTLWKTRGLLRDADIRTVAPRPGGKRCASASTMVRFGPLELRDRRQSR